MFNLYILYCMQGPAHGRSQDLILGGAIWGAKRPNFFLPPPQHKLPPGAFSLWGGQNS